MKVIDNASVTVLHEAPGEPTTIELPPGSSFLCWTEDGRMTAFLSEEGMRCGPDEDELNAGALEAALAMLAIKDEGIRARVEALIEGEADVDRD